jgi:hypothetical protein
MFCKKIYRKKIAHMFSKMSDENKESMKKASEDLAAAFPYSAQEAADIILKSLNRESRSK